MSKSIRAVWVASALGLGVLLAGCVPLPPDPVPVPVTQPSAPPLPSTAAPDPTTGPADPDESQSGGAWPVAPTAVAAPATPTQFSTQVFETQWTWHVRGAASYSHDAEGTPAPEGYQIAVLTIDAERTGDEGLFSIDFDVFLVDDATGETYRAPLRDPDLHAANGWSDTSDGQGEGLEIMVVVPETVAITHWSFDQRYDGDHVFDVQLQG